MWDWDAESDAIYKTHFYEDLGYKEDERPNTLQENYELVHPIDLPWVKKNWRNHLNGVSSFFQAEYRVKAKSGEWIWFRERGKTVGHDEEGKSLRVSGTHMNISNIKAAEDQLALFAKAFENTLEGVLILNDNKEISAVNKSFTRITGYSYEEIQGKSAEILKSDRFSQQSYNKLWERLAEQEQMKGELWFCNKEGVEFPIWINVGVLKDENDHISHYVAAFSDITERKKKEKELRYLTNFDTLTHLPNRALLRDRIDHAIQHAHRKNVHVAAFFLDLDQFKHINDTLGFRFGDTLLTLVAGRLEKAMRSEDTVARLGGDEFVILLEDVTEISGLAHAAEKILSKIKQPFLIEGKEIHISSSIGIAVYPFDGETTSNLLKYAETAMYHAKSQGRNCFQFFAEEMNQRVIKQIEMGNALRTALEKKELKIFFQPQIDLNSGKTIGVEALLRWDHPEKGWIVPDEFIPIAEETGLILPIGEWVCHQAVLQGVKWRDMGFEPLRIGINLSAHQFHQFDIVALMKNILKETGFDASLIELEITEGTIMNDMEKTTSNLNDLRAMGVRLAVDDFGTGYCSLSYLREFPLNSLKIDKSFIDDISGKGQGSKIVSSVIKLARDLELEVIAEGVETKEHIEFLKENHCDIAQGFFFSKPLPVDEFERIWLLNPPGMNTLELL